MFCRLCLKYSEILHSIINSELKCAELTLIESLYWIFGVEVDVNDPYSKLICTRCENVVQYIGSYRTLYQGNQLILEEKIDSDSDYDEWIAQRNLTTMNKKEVLVNAKTNNELGRKAKTRRLKFIKYYSGFRTSALQELMGFKKLNEKYDNNEPLVHVNEVNVEVCKHCSEIFRTKGLLEYHYQTRHKLGGKTLKLKQLGRNSKNFFSKHLEKQKNICTQDNVVSEKLLNKPHFHNRLFEKDNETKNFLFDISDFPNLNFMKQLDKRENESEKHTADKLNVPNGQSSSESQKNDESVYNNYENDDAFNLKITVINRNSSNSRDFYVPLEKCVIPTQIDELQDISENNDGNMTNSETETEPQLSDSDSEEKMKSVFSKNKEKISLLKGLSISIPKCDMPVEFEQGVFLDPNHEGNKQGKMKQWKNHISDTLFKLQRITSDKKEVRKTNDFSKRSNDKSNVEIQSIKLSNKCISENDVRNLYKQLNLKDLCVSIKKYPVPKNFETLKQKRNDLQIIGKSKNRDIDNAADCLNIPTENIVSSTESIHSCNYFSENIKKRKRAYDMDETESLLTLKNLTIAIPRIDILLKKKKKYNIVDKSCKPRCKKIEGLANIPQTSLRKTKNTSLYRMPQLKKEIMGKRSLPRIISDEPPKLELQVKKLPSIKPVPPTAVLKYNDYVKMFKKNKRRMNTKVKNIGMAENPVKTKQQVQRNNQESTVVSGEISKEMKKLIESLKSVELEYNEYTDNKLSKNKLLITKSERFPHHLNKEKNEGSNKNIDVITDENDFADESTSHCAVDDSNFKTSEKDQQAMDLNTNGEEENMEMWRSQMSNILSKLKCIEADDSTDGESTPDKTESVFNNSNVSEEGIVEGKASITIDDKNTEEKTVGNYSKQPEEVDAIHDTCALAKANYSESGNNSEANSASTNLNRHNENEINVEYFENYISSATKTKDQSTVDGKNEKGAGDIQILFQLKHVEDDVGELQNITEEEGIPSCLDTDDRIASKEIEKENTTDFKNAKERVNDSSKFSVKNIANQNICFITNDVASILEDHNNKIENKNTLQHKDDKATNSRPFEDVSKLAEPKNPVIEDEKWGMWKNQILNVLFRSKHEDGETKQENTKEKSTQNCPDKEGDTSNSTFSANDVTEHDGFPMVTDVADISDNNKIDTETSGFKSEQNSTHKTPLVAKDTANLESCNKIIDMNTPHHFDKESQNINNFNLPEKNMNKLPKTKHSNTVDEGVKNEIWKKQIPNILNKLKQIDKEEVTDEENIKGEESTPSYQDKEGRSDNTEFFEQDIEDGINPMAKTGVAEEDDTKIEKVIAKDIADKPEHCNKIEDTGIPHHINKRDNIKNFKHSKKNIKLAKTQDTINDKKEKRTWKKQIPNIFSKLKQIEEANITEQENIIKERTGSNKDMTGVSENENKNAKKNIHSKIDDDSYETTLLENVIPIEFNNELIKGNANIKIQSIKLNNGCISEDNIRSQYKQLNLKNVCISIKRCSTPKNTQKFEGEEKEIHNTYLLAKDTEEHNKRENKITNHSNEQSKLSTSKDHDIVDKEKVKGTWKKQIPNLLSILNQVEQDDVLMVKDAAKVPETDNKIDENIIKQENISEEEITPYDHKEKTDSYFNIGEEGSNLEALESISGGSNRRKNDKNCSELTKHKNVTEMKKSTLKQILKNKANDSNNDFQNIIRSRWSNITKGQIITAIETSNLSSSNKDLQNDGI